MRPRPRATIQKDCREAAKLRDAASVARIVIVEGYDGPQPG